MDHCWEFVNLNSTKIIFPTVLHLCSAHIMHGLSYRLEKNFKIKKHWKQLILHAIGTILKSSRILEINLVFTSLCYLLSSEIMSSTVNRSLLDLEVIVKGEMEINDFQQEQIDKESKFMENGLTYRKQSPFGRHFDTLYNNCLDKIQSEDASRLNKIVHLSYFPDILEYLLTYYFPIIPFWTGIILSTVRVSEKTTDSNAIVENWFKIVKHSIFKSETNIRPGDFIRTIYSHIDDRMAGFQFAFPPLAQKMFKQKKLKRELVNEEHCKEEWAKRKKVKTSYISPLPRKIEKVFSQFKDFDRNAASSEN